MGLSLVHSNGDGYAMKKLLLTLLVAGMSATAFSEQLVMQCGGGNVYMMDTDKGQLFIRYQGQWEQRCGKDTRVGYDNVAKEDLRTDTFGEVDGKSYICMEIQTGVTSNKQLGTQKHWYDFLIGETGWSMDDKVIDKQSCRLM